MAGTVSVESSEQFQLLLYLCATFFKTQESCLRLSLMQQNQGDEYPEYFVFERCVGEQSPNT